VPFVFERFVTGFIRAHRPEEPAAGAVPLIFRNGKTARRVNAMDWDRLDDDAKAEWEARKAALPQRKFLTVHDATAWLAKNRPDIDLEVPWTPDQ
jgi:hypothetical protein